MRAALALILLAGPAFAQDTFSLPGGCSAFVTVQSESCQVSHHFVCESDPEGHKRRVSLDEQGMIYSGMIDSEAQWISSFHVMSGHSEVLESNPAEPASFSELLATNLDEFDFRTLSDEIGVTRYVGRDTLTGREVTIDGVTLLETTYEVTAYDPAGNAVWAAKGREFINPDWRMFVAGAGTVTTPDSTYERSNRPVEFIFPGEPGFLSANPKHGCGLALS